MEHCATPGWRLANSPVGFVGFSSTRCSLPRTPALKWLFEHETRRAMHLEQSSAPSSVIFSLIMQHIQGPGTDRCSSEWCAAESHIIKSSQDFSRSPRVSVWVCSCFLPQAKHKHRLGLSYLETLNCQLVSVAQCQLWLAPAPPSFNLCWYWLM